MRNELIFVFWWQSAVSYINESSVWNKGKVLLDLSKFKTSTELRFWPYCKFPMFLSPFEFRWNSTAWLTTKLFNIYNKKSWGDTKIIYVINFFLARTNKTFKWAINNHLLELVGWWEENALILICYVDGESFDVPLAVFILLHLVDLNSWIVKSPTG